MNSHEKIFARIPVIEEFSSGFNMEFYELFKKNPEEMTTSLMKNTMGKMDGSYLAHLILSGDLETWLHIANMNLPLSHNMMQFTDFYENILAYFANPDFTQWDLKNMETEFVEIVDYIMKKFPKSDILAHNIGQKIAKI